jgi:hypothetical protein
MLCANASIDIHACKADNTAECQQRDVATSVVQARRHKPLHAKHAHVPERIGGPGCFIRAQQRTVRV